MGRKSIPILLKATSPEGETKTFTSIGEAAKNWDLANMELVKHSMKREIELVNMSIIKADYRLFLTLIFSTIPL